MSDTNFLKINDIDLEVGSNDNNNNNNNNNNNQEILRTVELNNRTTTISTSSDDFVVSYCMKSSIWIFIMIIAFPLTFCDLYYGYNDNSCVSEPVGKLAINLKDYLLINGWINMSIITIITLGLCFIDYDSISKSDNTCFVCCGGLSFILIAIIGIFSIILNIFGAVIFWSLMDTSDCESGIYNYVFASLIIKLCFNAISILQRKNDKE